MWIYHIIVEVLICDTEWSNKDANDVVFSFALKFWISRKIASVAGNKEWDNSETHELNNSKYEFLIARKKWEKYKSNIKYSRNALY